jgi:pimeloyl-ACP methyl ester carboxylesterase
MATNIYYEVHGNGPALVFAHGLGGNHASWFNQVPFFSHHFKVVTFDHRGFGNSRDVQGGADRTRFVDDLKDLLDHLEITKTALVAQSMGGGTCATFTVLNPNRVTALVLADTLVGITIPESLRARMNAVRNATSDLPQIERVLSAGFREREPVLTHLYTELNNFNQGARDSLRGNLPGITINQLSAVKIPLLFLAGTKDILFPPDLVRSIHELIPGAEYHEIAESGHSAYFEKPHEFNETVLNFLKKSGATPQ